MTLITGNTYPVKEQLKALGGKWNNDKKGWVLPDENADKARTLVAGAPQQQKPYRSNGYRPGRRCYCSECGEPYRRGQRCWETGGFCSPEWE